MHYTVIGLFSKVKDETVAIRTFYLVAQISCSATIESVDLTIVVTTIVLSNGPLVNIQIPAQTLHGHG